MDLERLREASARQLETTRLAPRPLRFYQVEVKRKGISSAAGRVS